VPLIPRIDQSVYERRVEENQRRCGGQGSISLTPPGIVIVTLGQVSDAEVRRQREDRG
jgi:hypothetical protein